MDSGLEISSPQDVIESLDASAARHDAVARDLARFARDCDRWGLAFEGAEARSKGRHALVSALICRARAAGLRAQRTRRGAPRR